MKSILTLLLAVYLLTFSPEIIAQVPVTLTTVEFATGFNNAVDIVNAGDERLFVVEKSGRIKIVLPDGSTLPTNFLSITNLTTGSGERGLLGLAFHPDYATNGYFFVNYTMSGSGATRISRFTVADDPNVADVNSREDIITISQPYSNHNGGCLRFGPDGYLYIGMGDGGSGGDPDNYAQNINSLLGKMLRLDVDNGLPYTIPADNPFVGEATLDEIYQVGLRNPWKFAFDTETGDLWSGDVGQGAWEEVNMKPASEPGGQNYGWRCYEGTNTFNTNGCQFITNYDMPVAEYDHSGGSCSITGGFVYRGQANQDMIGKYVTTDYCSGRFWTVEQNDADEWIIEVVYNSGMFGWSSFGEDINGEMYATDGTDIYLVIDEDCEDFEVTFTPGVEGGGFADIADAASYQWLLDGVPVEGATGAEFFVDESGEYSLELISADGCYGISEPQVINPTSLAENEAAWTFDLFPNPAVDVMTFTISKSTERIERMQIIDMKGSVIMSEQIGQTGVGYTRTLDVSDLGAGRYTLLIEGERSYTTRSFVIGQ